MRTIPLEECEIGRVYRIKSRNLVIGIYVGDGAFVGIREKFGSQYLFAEMHWDSSPTIGTVKPYEALDLVPSDLNILDWCENDRAVWKPIFDYLDPLTTQEYQRTSSVEYYT